MDYKDKIRKLLALAKSPEPEEAKFALLKARKLAHSAGPCGGELQGQVWQVHRREVHGL